MVVIYVLVIMPSYKAGNLCRFSQPFSAVCIIPLLIAIQASSGSFWRLSLDLAPLIYYSFFQGGWGEMSRLSQPNPSWVLWIFVTNKYSSCWTKANLFFQLLACLLGCSHSRNCRWYTTLIMPGFLSPCEDLTEFLPLTIILIITKFSHKRKHAFD